MTRPVITLLTDFGDHDAYVGIMKGVLLGLCPEAQLVDLTHQVRPHNVRVGALILRSAVPFFPRGTIHVAVVDPGVGSARAAVLVQTPTAWLAGPDNGLLHPAASVLGIQRVIALTNPRYCLSTVSQTFHGRDVFAPAAGHLAAGADPAAFGPAQDTLLPLELPAVRGEAEQLMGEVIYIDQFGNLITNITELELARFSRSTVSVSIATCMSVPMVSTYAEVAPGELVALIGSWGHLEIAIREGSAAVKLGATSGMRVTVRKR